MQKCRLTCDRVNVKLIRTSRLKIECVILIASCPTTRARLATNKPSNDCAGDCTCGNSRSLIHNCGRGSRTNTSGSRSNSCSTSTDCGPSSNLIPDATDSGCRCGSTPHSNRHYIDVTRGLPEDYCRVFRIWRTTSCIWSSWRLFNMVVEWHGLRLHSIVRCNLRVDLKLRPKLIQLLC